MDIALGFVSIKIYEADQNRQPQVLVAEYQKYKDALTFKGNPLKNHIYVVDGKHMDFENFRERAFLFLDEIS